MERAVYDEPTDEPVQCLLPQHVKRALVYLRGNVAEKITLPGLAAACAVPERTLLKQFRRFVGLSPLAYLRRLRLNLARGDLLRADCETAISEIAINCGFTHLGRFATEYRRAFDESPSATRQRVRSNGAGDASLLGPVVWRAKPVLLLVPFRTETLQEELETRDLMERLGATLTIRQSASVQHGAPGIPGTVRLLNQSANTPLVSGGGAANVVAAAVVTRDADTARFLTTLRNMTRIRGLVEGGMTCLFITASLNEGRR